LLGPATTNSKVGGLVNENTSSLPTEDLSAYLLQLITYSRNSMDIKILRRIPLTSWTSDRDGRRGPHWNVSRRLVRDDAQAGVDVLLRMIKSITSGSFGTLALGCGARRRHEARGSARAQVEHLLRDFTTLALVLGLAAVESRASGEGCRARGICRRGKGWRNTQDAPDFSASVPTSFFDAAAKGKE